jgi:aminoglycoside phosphotransferase (APT) family kinase protein
MSATSLQDVRHLALERLVPYLEARLPGFKGPATARKFATGQSNPTFLLEAASGRYVVRRKPPGVLLKSAHAVEREYRVMQALAATDVPVPQAYLLCEDPEIVGTPFFVMQYLEGRIFWDPALPELPADARAAYYGELVRVLGNLARLDPASVGLSDYGKPGGYVERQLSRWIQQYRASETEHIEDMETLIAWLSAQRIAESGTALVHGDLRFDNMIMHPSEPRALGVLDWELSTLGPPLVDITYFCTMLRLPRHSGVKGLAGLDRREHGIPEEQALVDDFVRHSGFAKPKEWTFWLAFHCFRFAAIIQGVLKRRLDGNASDTDSTRHAGMVGLAARLGREIAERG